jgi:serine/threonine-protein kinase
VKEGDQLGKYRIVRQMEPHIWLAERLEDFDRQVAAVFTPGILEPEDQAAFRERRRRIAAMDHPAIPRFMDAGETSERLSYNLFEYIPDDAVLGVAHAQQWTLARRIAVALEYLDALALAHRNLLAHGSLSVDGFRVTSSGQPRIVLFPATESLDNPVEADLRAAIEFLAILIAECGEKKVPRDLKAIVDKAHEVGAAQSYDSVYALEQDVRAFLEHRPVSARTASPIHRTALFARRRPVMFFAGVTLLATVLGAAGYSFAKESAAQRSRAQAETRLRQLQRLTYSLESDMYEPVSKLPNSQAAKKVLIEWTSESLDELKGEAGADAELRRELANAYQRLAAVLRANGQLDEAARAESNAYMLKNESGTH